MKYELWIMKYEFWGIYSFLRLYSYGVGFWNFGL
ncbi:MAG: hypothetical protein FMNOHCHN_01718 [Ignavibacteriaceae bacterium]|nr:hypothetical protein [Ignavibacteriaceae bacterium]